MPTEEELRQLPENLNTENAKKIKIDADQSANNTESTKTKYQYEDDFEQQESDDFLPLSTTKTKFRVIHAAKEAKSSKLDSCVANSVLKFRETMLYGAGSKNRREPSEDAVRRQQKVQTMRSVVKR